MTSEKVQWEKLVVHKGGQDLHFAGRVWVVDPAIIDVKAVTPIKKVSTWHIERALVWLHMSPSLPMRNHTLEPQEFTNYYLIGHHLGSAQLVEEAERMFENDEHHHKLGVYKRWLTHFYVLEGLRKVADIKKRKNFQPQLSTIKQICKNNEYHIPMDKLSKEAMQILLGLPA